MADLAEPALKVVREKKIEIHPERYAKSYLDWLGEKTRLASQSSTLVGPSDSNMACFRRNT